MTSKRFNIFCVGVFSIGLMAIGTGCSSPKSWSYSPTPRKTTPPLANKSVVVLPFQDARTNKNSSLWAMYMIPLMPFGWIDANTPEGLQMHLNSGVWQFKPTEDFAKAVTEEIENARIFQETFLGNKASDGDLVLMGQVVSTGYNGKLISYGLSVEGPLLWLIGFPASTVKNNLELRLTLARTPSDVPIWSHTIKEEASNVSWIYALRPDFRYDELLKKGMDEVIKSLSEETKNIK